MSDVHNVTSTLEARVSDVSDFVDTVDASDLPGDIESLELVRQNNQIHIESNTDRDDIGKYTPTACLVGTTRDRTVIVENGEPTHNTVRQEEAERTGWADLSEEENVETTDVEYVKFQGEDDRVLRNTALRTEMFRVLCRLADISYYGSVEGVIVDEDGLTPVRHDAGGEEVDVELSLEASEETTFEADDDRSQMLQWSST